MQLTEEDVMSLRMQAAHSAIHETLHRYCRGVDRADIDILLSAFHADAYDDHGSRKGPIAEVAEVLIPMIRDTLSGMQHALSNILIELDGNMARVESYFTSTLRYRVKPDVVSVFGGRYLDRFEKRRTQWLIARRTVIHEWSWTQALPSDSARVVGYPAGRMNKDDPLYQRSTWEPWIVTGAG
jgi:hypothetical protein